MLSLNEVPDVIQKPGREPGRRTFVFSFPESRSYYEADYYGELSSSMRPGNKFEYKGADHVIEEVQQTQQNGKIFYRLETQELSNTPKTPNQWCEAIHNLSTEKGWYATDRKPAEFHMLFVSEIAEATEEVRNGKPSVYWETPTGMVTQQDAGGGGSLKVGDTLQKPEGEAVELMDAVIRIMDYFAFKGWDFEQVLKMKYEYNQTRGHRHGGKLL